MTREIINIKINKVMTRKKRTKEEQPLTTEVVGAKKKSPKKKKAVEEKPVVVVQEQEASVNEPTTQENVAENTPEKREYTIDELIDMLGPDIECEDEAEVEDTSSSEREDNGEDIFAALDDWDEDDDEEISDEIIDMFDKTLEEKGLGDAYFERLERNIKEHEEAQKERELYIDEVKWILLIITTIGLLLAISLRICLMRKVGLYSIRLVVFIPIMTMMKLIVNIPL